MNESTSSRVSDIEILKRAATIIEEKHGSEARIHYEDAIAAYISQDVEPTELAGYMVVAWPNTKAILDKHFAKSPGSTEKKNPYASFKSILDSSSAKNKQKVAELADDTGLTAGEIELFLLRFGDCFSEEAYEKEMESGKTWESYADYIECLITGKESFSAEYEHSWISLLQHIATEKGNPISFDESMKYRQQLKELRESGNWDEWRKLREELFGNENAPAEEAERIYVSDVVMMETIEKGKLNFILAGCGTGKTYFVENMLKDYRENPEEDMLYLAPTRALKRAFNFRGTPHETALPSGESIIEWKQDGVTAMTYAAFGKMIHDAQKAGTYKKGMFWNNHSLICPDELSQAVKQAQYDKFAPVNYGEIALDELEERINNKTNTVLTVTATPKLGLRRYVHWESLKVPHKVKLSAEPTAYKDGTVDYYYEIDNLLQTLDPSARGMIYVQRVDTMKKLAQKLSSKGIKAVGIFSEISKKHKMTEEELRVSRTVVEEERIPDDIQVLLINAAYETGLNIRPELSPLDYVIVHDAGEDAQIQARGRYRGDLKKLYLKTKYEEAPREVPEEVICNYLCRWLGKEEKAALCEALAFRDKNGRICMWPSVKKILEECGYEVVEKKSSRMYAWIEDHSD